MSRTAQTHDRDRVASTATRDAGTPPSTAKAHSCAPDERRPAWDLARGRPYRPWRKKGERTGRGKCAAHREYHQPPRARAAHWGERHYLNHEIHEIHENENG